MTVFQSFGPVSPDFFLLKGKQIPGKHIIGSLAHRVKVFLKNCRQYCRTRWPSAMFPIWDIELQINTRFSTSKT